MREVVPGRIWIGNALDVDDIRRVLDAGIEAIVDLAIQEVPPRMTRETIYLRFPLNDGAGNSANTLRTILESVASLLRRQIPTLIFCSAGMSRSPSVAAFALALAENRDPHDCVAQILDDGPRDVSPLLWQSLEQVYNEIVLND